MVYEWRGGQPPPVAAKPVARSNLNVPTPRQARSHSMPSVDVEQVLTSHLELRRSSLHPVLTEEAKRQHRPSCDSLVPISILDEDLNNVSETHISIFNRNRAMTCVQMNSQRRLSQPAIPATINQTESASNSKSEIRHKPAIVTQDTSTVRYYASRRHPTKRKSSQESYQFSKAKLTQLLKTTQLEQLSKLQSKHQQECDLLDDIRNFGKQRSQLEKDYGQALQKLALQFQKRESTASTDEEETDKNCIEKHKPVISAFPTVQTVWKSLLEATDKAGQARITASEYYKNNVYEAAKNCKAQKDAQLKKCQDLLNTLQNEITDTVKELTKAKKKYYELEQVSQSANEKYQEINDRLKKNQTSKFTFKSKAGLEKAFQKLQQKCDEGQTNSTVARNEYLLMLVAANSHQKRYYETDMPEAMRILDGDLFGKFQDYLSSLSQFELDACNASREAHVQALQDASKISREYNIRCFLRENPVFEWGPKYEFEACGNDEVTHLVQEQSGDDNSLNREARKWTTRVVRDERNLQRLNKMKQGLEGLTLKYAESPELHIESAVQETEVRLEKCREDLRRTETNHLRGEARLQLLRDVHVNVDTWLESARAQAAKELEESVSTPGYANKRRSLHNRSLRGASLANGAQMSLGGDDDFCDEDFIEDETFDEDDHIMMMEKDNLSLPSSDHSRSYPVTCTVSYPYQATRADELTISVGDRIDVVEDGDLDQWVKAKDGSGHVGYVPENYLEFPTNSTTPHHHYALPPGEDYTNTLGSTSSGSITSGTSSLTTNSSGNDPEVTTITSKAAINQDKKQGICLAKAIYEYEACSEEELTFPEGAIISVLSKDDNGIDDGWWKGELNGKVGVFPGLVVEELGSCDVNPTSSPSNSPTNDRPPSFRPPTPSSSPKATGRQKWNGSPDSGVNTLRHSPIPSSMLGVPDVNHGRTNSAPASPIYATVKPKPNRSAPAPPKRPVSFIRTTKP